MPILVQKLTKKNMEKPFKYTVICDKTKKILFSTNQEPYPHQLLTWEDTPNKNIKKLTQSRTVFIDTRFEAKIRLFNYINFTKKGLKVPKYSPYENTEIGKTIPILNF